MYLEEQHLKRKFSQAVINGHGTHSRLLSLNLVCFQWEINGKRIQWEVNGNNPMGNQWKKCSLITQWHGPDGRTIFTRQNSWCFRTSGTLKNSEKSNKSTTRKKKISFCGTRNVKKRKENEARFINGQKMSVQFTEERQRLRQEDERERGQKGEGFFPGKKSWTRDRGRRENWL